MSTRTLTASEQTEASRSQMTLAEDRWTYLWLLVGVGLLIVSNGRWIVPVATWLTPVFLLRFTRTQPALRGLGLLLVVNVAVYLFSWQEMIPGDFYLPVASGVGVVFWLPYLADRLLVPRLRGFVSTLVFPLFLVTLEYINTLANPFGSWGSLGYSQQGFLPFVQLVSITGMWGLTFLIAWLAPVVNWAWEQRFDWSHVRRGILTYAAALALVLFYGGLRIALFPPESETIKVASLVQTDDWGTFLELESALDSRGHFQELGNEMLEQSRAQAGAGVDVVMWQEAAIPVFAEDEASLIDQARALAREQDIYMLLGLITLTEDFPDEEGANQAVWITPDGEVMWRYLKARPVPGEPVLVGEDVIPMDETNQISSVICFDMDHPAYIRHAGLLGTSIMLVPSWDWEEISPFHTQMASFRAVENGFSMVRATGEGLSASYDYQGRVLSTADYFTTDGTMVSHVPTSGVKTIYSSVGDAFAWLSIAGLLTLVAMAFIKR